MGRILAIDMGEKRVGLAISDPMGIIAQPFKTIYRLGDDQLIRDLKKIVSEKAVECIVFGVPYKLSGKKTKMSLEIETFAERLMDESSIPVVFEDERLTTRMAEMSLHMMGKKVGQSRDKIDQIAAAHILQSYLKRRKG
jgi:putative Holliday junction resolvase